MDGYNQIKVIFFDLGQTLIELSSFKNCMYNLLNKYLSKSDININELINSWGFDTYNLFMKSRSNNYTNIFEINALSLKNIFKEKKIEISDNLIEKIIRDVWQDFVKENKLWDDVLPVLNQLKKSGFKLGIITDSELKIVNGIFKKHKLNKFFNVKIVSSEFKVYKPNPLLFYKAINLAKCDPSEGIYVGDSEIDVKGAAEIGLTTVIVNRNEIHDKKIGINVDYRIKSLSELPKLILEHCKK